MLIAEEGVAPRGLWPCTQCVENANVPVDWTNQQTRRLLCTHSDRPSRHSIVNHRTDRACYPGFVRNELSFELSTVYTCHSMNEIFLSLRAYGGIVRVVFFSCPGGTRNETVYRDTSNKNYAAVYCWQCTAGTENNAILTLVNKTLGENARTASQRTYQGSLKGLRSWLRSKIFGIFFPRKYAMNFAQLFLQLVTQSRGCYKNFFMQFSSIPRELLTMRFLMWRSWLCLVR